MRRVEPRGLGVQIIDALDSLWLLGLHEDFEMKVAVLRHLCARRLSASVSLSITAVQDYYEAERSLRICKDRQNLSDHMFDFARWVLWNFSSDLDVSAAGLPKKGLEIPSSFSHNSDFRV